MKENELVSVIIPCYKTDTTLLQRAVKSVLEQDYQNFEILIVDDGNDAEYKKAIKKIKQQDKRINVIEQEKNLGVSKARNDAAKKARGCYIAFVDGDDVVTKDFLKSAINNIDDADIIIGGVCIFDVYDNSTFASKNYETKKKTIYNDKNKSEIKINFIGERRKIGNIGYFSKGPVARLIKKSVIVSCPFREDIEIAEDSLWNIELVNTCDKIVLIEELWYGYYSNPESVSHVYDPEIIKKIEKPLKIVKDSYVDFTIEKEKEAYCIYLLESLKQVYNSYYSKIHHDFMCKIAVIDYLINNEPWSLLKEIKIQNAPLRLRIKKMLFKYRLYLPILNICNKYREEKNYEKH